MHYSTTWNTMLTLEKQALWQCGSTERIDSNNGTYFKNSLMNTWAREYSIEWVYHIPCHAPALRKLHDTMDS